MFPQQNYPQKLSKCSHSPSVFSHKIDSQHVSQAVLCWVGATSGASSDCGQHITPRPRVRKENLFAVTHQGHSATYTVSTCITLMVIRDRPGEASSYGGQGAAMHFLSPD